jgi:hypothetical protein
MTSAPQKASPEAFAHTATIGAGYGFWIATPKENAEVGIRF